MDKELLLHNYFSNQLTAEQLRVFNELLQTDPDFKRQFDFEKDLKQVIRHKETNALKGKLAGFEKDISTGTPVRKLPGTNYRKWAMAASIALLVGLGWLGYQNFIGPDYNNLYEENFQQYPNTVYAITRGEGGDNSLKRKAFVAYETDENIRAIELFEDLKTKQNSEEVIFYLAQSYLKNEQPEEALVLFNEIVSDKGEFVPQALWYAALANLKTDQKEKAVRALQELIADGRYKKEEASILLEKLE